MNIVNILEEIEKVDGEIYERLNPRRKAMKDFFSMGSKIALSAMPFALGSMFNKAYGQAMPSTVIEVLQYALTLEHFEYNFYLRANAATALPIPAGDQRNAIVMIRDSEKKHVDFLKTVLTQLNQTPVAEKTTYDFTAGGTFPDIFTNYGTFLAVAQAIEDTGVRAYKGRAGELKGEKVVLTAALGIHAVEARHAAKIRYMRRMNGAMDAFNGPVKPWIAGSTDKFNDLGVPAADGNYGGTVKENNVNQAGVVITNLAGIGGNIPYSAAAEAFDEPLTKAEVLALVAPFGVS
ncbi:ferritin-like domain-containing protein [Paradesertivirga mongoliensis]|uniref:Ferritin-like domain-containing protein n=1 Tax=Paradesertivirga mongoliensis TaxID=2100740 RepID=A0ABW4ZI90_9SPHI|nr:ferritin-like domain-containing protein [Pedobacter mongoliensis]